MAINAEKAAQDPHDTVAAIEARGRRAIAIPGDITETAQHHAMIDAAARLGALTTLVNNAGVGVLSRGDPLDTSPESYDRCQAVNARAVFFLSQAFARHLLAQQDTGMHRSIVNITASNAEAVALDRAEYAVSKAAASMVTRCFAARLAAEGIEVYEIQPGVIATDMTAPVLSAYEACIAAGLTLQPRVGKPGDVARVAAAMAAGRMAYCTGQAVRVDGGLLMRRF